MRFLIKSLVFIFFLLQTFNLIGQNDKIKKIKEQYYSVSKQIAECEKQNPDACSIYKNDLIINSNGEKTSNWPATGNYYKKITFYYNAAPAHWDKKGKQALLKIKIKEIYAANSDEYEFLFKNGEFIFCFYKQKYIGEYRFYFSNENLIKFLEKTESESEYYKIKKEDNKRLIKEANRLQKFFLNMFQ